MERFLMVKVSVAEPRLQHCSAVLVLGVTVASLSLAVYCLFEHMH